MDRRKTDRREDRTGDIYVLDVHALGGIILRRKALLIGLMLIVLIPGLAYVATKPSTYRAATSVIVDNQELNLAEFQDVLPAGKFDDVTVETQARVIGSPKIIHLTLDALEEQSDPKAAKEAPKDETAKEAAHQSATRYAAIRSFLANLEVTPQGRSRLIEVAFKSKDPIQAANIVNTHVQQYLRYQVENKKEQVELLNKWITDQVASLKEQGQIKSQAVQDYRKESGIMLGKDSEDLIHQQISDVSEQLIPVQTLRMNLQAKMDSLAASKGKGTMSDVVDSNLVQNLKTQASTAEQELKALEAQYGPSHPSVLAAKKKAQQANADVARESGNIKSSVKMQLATVTQQEQLLRARLDELNQQANELGSKETKLESLQAEETANKTLLDNFLARYEEIKSQLDLSRADVRIVSPAEIPTDPIGMKKPFMMLMVSLLALVFAVGSVLVLEMIDRGIESGEDIKKQLNLKLIGMLPKVKNPLTTIGGKTGMAYSEEIKRIYLALAAKKAPQSIMFTAANSGEGKSTALMSLANYLQSIRAKVVVVDANTSSPSLATIAGTNSSPGYAEIMAGAVDITKGIYKDGNGLTVIPAGNTSSYPVDLLASESFQRMMTNLKSQYDFVLIDCAPLLKTTDAEIISGLADQVVLVIEWAKTPKKQLKKVAEILRQYAKETPNVILNKHS